MLKFLFRKTPNERAVIDIEESARELYAAKLRLDEAQASIALHSARIARLKAEYDTEPVSVFTYNITGHEN